MLLSRNLLVFYKSTKSDFIKDNVKQKAEPGLERFPFLQKAMLELIILTNGMISEMNHNCEEHSFTGLHYFKEHPTPPPPPLLKATS